MARFDFLALDPEGRERQGLLEGVVISGGEPTLHSDLPDLCRRIKHMGYAVKMDTNGSRPQMLRRLITENLVDYLAMDIKMEPDRYVGGVTRQCDTGAILDSLPRRPLLAGEKGIRLSLAGAQPKLPVVVTGGAVALPALQHPACDQQADRFARGGA